MTIFAPPFQYRQYLRMTRLDSVRDSGIDLCTFFFFVFFSFFFADIDHHRDYLKDYRDTFDHAFPAT